MLLMIARSSLALYTQASSLLSNPTRTLSSRILGSLDNMSLRTPGPTLAPHPPAAVISVSLTSSSAIGMAQQDFFSLSPIILFLFLLLNLVKSYSGNNHNALQNIYTLLASASSSIALRAVSISSSVLNGPIENRTVPSGNVCRDSCASGAQ